MPTENKPKKKSKKIKKVQKFSLVLSIQHAIAGALSGYVFMVLMGADQINPKLPLLGLAYGAITGPGHDLWAFIRKSKSLKGN